MARFILKRHRRSASITLFLLSIIVFFARAGAARATWGGAILGPFADQQAVDALNHKLGTDRPLLTQYSDWIGELRARATWARRCVFRQPVSDVLWPALGQFGEARAARVRHRRAARRSSAASSRRCNEGSAARPHHPRRRPVGDGDAGVRLGVVL